MSNNSIIALVTGSTGDIGNAICEVLAKKGIDLILVSRNKDNLIAQSIELGLANIAAYCLDLSDHKQIKELEEQLIKSNLNPQILINCISGSSFRVTENEWEKAFMGKLNSYIQTCEKLSPLMSQNSWGRIINVAGATAFRPNTQLKIQGVVNAAIVNYSITLAKELAPQNITVNTINPGYIRSLRMEKYLENNPIKEILLTNMRKEIPSGKFGTPEDVANVAAFLCSQESSYISGQNLSVDCGASQAVV